MSNVLQGDLLKEKVSKGDSLYLGGDTDFNDFSEHRIFLASHTKLYKELTKDKAVKGVAFLESLAFPPRVATKTQEWFFDQPLLIVYVDGTVKYLNVYTSHCYAAILDDWEVSAYTEDAQGRKVFRSLDPMEVDGVMDIYDFDNLGQIGIYNVTGQYRNLEEFNPMESLLHVKLRESVIVLRVPLEGAPVTESEIVERIDKAYQTASIGALLKSTHTSVYVANKEKYKEVLERVYKQEVLKVTLAKFKGAKWEHVKLVVDKHGFTFDVHHAFISSLQAYLFVTPFISLIFDPKAKGNKVHQLHNLGVQTIEESLATLKAFPPLQQLVYCTDLRRKVPTVLR